MDSCCFKISTALYNACAFMREAYKKKKKAVVGRLPKTSEKRPRLKYKAACVLGREV